MERKTHKRKEEKKITTDDHEKGCEYIIVNV